MCIHMATLDQIFTSHLMFQSIQPIRIFGTSSGNISVSIADRTGAVRSTGSDWLIALDPHDYGGLYTMAVVTDGEQTVLEEIHFGDVCLLGSQSNMQMKLLEYDEPAENCKAYERVRLFTVDRPKDGECIFSKDGWFCAQMSSPANSRPSATMCEHNFPKIRVIRSD